MLCCRQKSSFSICCILFCSTSDFDFERKFPQLELQETRLKSLYYLIFRREAYEINYNFSSRLLWKLSVKCFACKTD